MGLLEVALVLPENKVPQYPNSHKNHTVFPTGFAVLI
jgi:hypothetical protein